jgi:hypothetical protein
MNALTVDAHLAWAVADCLDIALAKGCTLPADKLERFRQLCLVAIEQEIPLEPRQALAAIPPRTAGPRSKGPLPFPATR